MSYTNVYNELYKRKITTTQFVCSTLFGNTSFFSLRGKVLYGPDKLGYDWNFVLFLSFQCSPKCMSGSVVFRLHSTKRGLLYVAFHDFDTHPGVMIGAFPETGFVAFAVECAVSEYGPVPFSVFAVDEFLPDELPAADDVAQSTSIAEMFV